MSQKKQKPPAFQWYPKDYMSDANVLRMTFEERGIYNWLMCSAWLEGGIPDSVPELARLCGLSKRKMERVWPRIGPCFEPSSTHAGWLVHSRLESERQKQIENRDKRSRAGKAGADAKHGGVANG